MVVGSTSASCCGTYKPSSSGVGTPPFTSYVPDAATTSGEPAEFLPATLVHGVEIVPKGISTAAPFCAKGNDAVK
jgi:hypothetical protein